MLAAADAALYHAKETGRNKTHVVTASAPGLLEPLQPHSAPSTVMIGPERQIPRFSARKRAGILA